MSELLRKLGLPPHGGSGNSETVKRKMIDSNIDFSHFDNKHKYISSTSGATRKTLREVLNLFRENSQYYPRMRIWVIKFKLLPYICECSNTGVWQGKPLSLQLDHKDGNRRNNNLTNLRWLCPNCHTQTITYGPKRLKKEKPAKKRKPPKIVPPTRETLIQLLAIKSRSQAAKEIKCSKNMLLFWINKYRITTNEITNYKV